MVDKKDFRKEISELFNPNLDIYSHAIITKDCWQASPGKTIDLLRKIGNQEGGQILEGVEVVDLEKHNNEYLVLLRVSKLASNNIYIGNKRVDTEYIQVRTPIFINALGSNASKFALKLGI